MTPQERDVLLPLLDRLRQTRVADKDADADQLIRQTVQAQPDAPYILAQTVLMQDYALHAAQDRIHALEQQLSERQQQAPHASGGSFLGSLFGGGRSPAPAPPVPPGPGQTGLGGGAPGGPPSAPPTYGPQIASAVQPGSGQSSFLRSAAQTAAGIAGGALLFQGLEGLFGGHGGFGGVGFLGGAAGVPGYAPMESAVEPMPNADMPNTYDSYDGQRLPDDQGDMRGADSTDVADQSTFDDSSGYDTGGDFSGDDSFNS